MIDHHHIYSLVGNEGIDFLHQIYVTTLEMSRVSSVGIATRYGLHDPAIECQADPVAERSKARACGRSLAAASGSNPAGGMDVLYSKGQRAKPGQSRQRENNKISGGLKRVGVWGRNFNINNNV